jgi:hypothetical protein
MGLGSGSNASTTPAMLKREAPRTKSEYVYRRKLEPQELLPALGVAVGVGAFAFYVAYLFLQRTPLDPNTIAATTPRRRLSSGASD